MLLKLLQCFASPFGLAAGLVAVLSAAPWQSAVALSEYRVGVEAVDYYPIYSVAPPDRQYRGYARDLLDLFAAHEKIRLHYVPLPVRRLAHEYWAGELDLMFPDNPRWSEVGKPATGITYSQAVLKFQDAILVLPARLGQPRASFRKIGFVHGFTPWKFQAEITAGQVEIHQSPNPEGLIRMTLAGYIDGANLAQQVAHYHLARLGRPQALVVEPNVLPLNDSYFYLSSIRHPELIRRFDAFLLSQAPAIGALKAKYGL